MLFWTQFFLLALSTAGLTAGCVCVCVCVCACVCARVYVRVCKVSIQRGCSGIPPPPNLTSSPGF